MRTAEQIMFTTKDQTVNLDGKPLPAMTTMLHRVCDNDPNKFEEAIRLVGLILGSATAELAQLRAENAELREVLRPFAEEHVMGDNYVQFAPRLLVAARAILARHKAVTQGGRDG